MNLGFLMSTILREDAKVGMDILNAIESENGKRAAILAVAKDRLNQTTYQELVGVLAQVRKRRGERNDVVHGMWGVSQNYPHGLIWQDPRECLRSLAQTAISQATGSPPPPTDSFESCLVYVERDFIAIESRLEATRAGIANLWLKILHRPNETRPPSKTNFAASP
jgi:hypothetical protein